MTYELKNKTFDGVVEVMAKNTKHALNKFKKDKTRLKWCKNITVRKHIRSGGMMMSSLPNGYNYYLVYYNYKN